MNEGGKGRIKKLPAMVSFHAKGESHVSLFAFQPFSAISCSSLNFHTILKCTHSAFNLQQWVMRRHRTPKSERARKLIPLEDNRRRGWLVVQRQSFLLEADQILKLKTIFSSKHFKNLSKFSTSIWSQNFYKVHGSTSNRLLWLREGKRVLRKGIFEYLSSFLAGDAWERF